MLVRVATLSEDTESDLHCQNLKSSQVLALAGHWKSRSCEAPCIQLPPVPVAVQKAGKASCSAPGWCLLSLQVLYGCNCHFPRRYTKASAGLNCLSGGMTSKFRRIWSCSF